MVRTENSTIPTIASSSESLAFGPEEASRRASRRLKLLAIVFIVAVVGIMAYLYTSMAHP